VEDPRDWQDPQRRQIIRDTGNRVVSCHQQALTRPGRMFGPNGIEVFADPVMNPPLAQHAKPQPAQNKQRDEQQPTAACPREPRRPETVERPVQLQQIKYRHCGLFPGAVPARVKPSRPLGTIEPIVDIA